MVDLRRSIPPFAGVRVVLKLPILAGNLPAGMVRVVLRIGARWPKLPLLRVSAVDQLPIFAGQLPTPLMRIVLGHRVWGRELPNVFVGVFTLTKIISALRMAGSTLVEKNRFRPRQRLTTSSNPGS